MKNQKYEQPLISIVVPTRNMGKYIFKCIDSIINQTEKKLQIIVVDYGSNDDSVNIINKFKDKRLKLIECLSPDAADARNVGMEYVLGEFVAFIDADDWLDKNFCSKIIDTMRNKKADVGICNFSNIDENSKNKSDINLVNKDGKINKKNIEKYLIDFSKGIINNECWNKVYQTKIIKDNQIKFNNIYGPNGEDLLFNVNILLKYPKLCYINSHLYFHLIRNNSLGSAGNKRLGSRFSEIFSIINNELDNKKIKLDEYIINQFMILLILTVNLAKNVKIGKEELKIFKNNSSYFSLLKKGIFYNNFNLKIKLLCILLFLRLDSIACYLIVKKGEKRV
jgi:glycosyltransferase involved in cell wall biosynthesis